MSKANIIFYDHLILIGEVTSQLESFALDPEEKTEILELVDQTLHHHTLNVILNHLPKKHHREFITHFHSAPHDKQLMNFLKDHTTVDIESEIKKIAEKIKKDILSDIQTSRHK